MPEPMGSTKPVAYYRKKQSVSKIDHETEAPAFATVLTVYLTGKASRNRGSAKPEPRSCRRKSGSIRILYVAQAATSWKSCVQTPNVM